MDNAKGFIVTLNKSIHRDEVERVVGLLRLIQGVVSVKPVPEDPHDFIIRQQVTHEMRMKLYKALD